MGYDYALVHLKYTIPPGIVLTLLYRPLLQLTDLYKILFLITVAVLSSTPWDSYLIRNQIWTYPTTAVLGPKLFLIPIEEVFFFVIQTYITTLLYLLFNKPLFHPAFLVDRSSVASCSKRKKLGRSIQAVLIILFIGAAGLFYRGGDATYLSLILLWALPFIFLLWSLSNQFILSLPYTSTLLPILLPTFYLWIVDTISLRRGTWKILPGTKLNLYLWEGLEIEEAIFFLASNVLVVFGLVSFDHSITILQSFPDVFPDVSNVPSPVLMIKALMTQDCDLDNERISGIKCAVERLKKKSRSFYLASATFSGRLRIDLILLYSFCRVADDLVDNALTESEARQWISKITKFLDLAYTKCQKKEDRPWSKNILQSYIKENFPPSVHSALQLLPAHCLSPQPLYDLLDGFTTDVEFLKLRHGKFTGSFPISDESCLEVYAARVAGTVAELILELVFHHSKIKTSQSQQKRLLGAGRRMGIALQYVNISRDIETDAKINRVYLPALWIKDEGITHEQVLTQPSGAAIERLRRRILGLAFKNYYDAREVMTEIPSEARPPMRVAVESYMEIGRVLREDHRPMKNGRATVPVWRRLKVAWKALNASQCSCRM